MKFIRTNTRSDLYLLLFLIVLGGLFLNSCQQRDHSSQAEKEIEATEIAFAKAAKEKGIATAFLAFAAEDAVLLRNNRLVRGKTEIADYFSKSTLQNASLEWTPDMVVAAKSGDLGYTWGKYTFSAKDSTGLDIRSEGIFHSVWKKQTDGSWKFVWD